MIYFVSRHQGAIEWIKQQPQWQIDHFIPHLNIDMIQKGDVVLGTLPLHIAAEVCAKGAVFYFLQVPQTLDNRGHEYSAVEMDQMGCSLRRFIVQADDS